MNRLTLEQARELYLHADLHTLGRMAHTACCRRHPEKWRTYVVDRNINYTNVCISGCRFCNFYVSPGDPRAYVLDEEQLLRKIEELQAIGGNQILLQGGLHPNLGLDWYRNMLKTIKTAFPRLHVHGFSPPEIVHVAELSKRSVEAVLAALRDAGLDTIPGGGAEILSDSVRRRISPQKCSARQWLDVMRTAHRIGIRSTATMMFGHVESIDDRLTHLQRIRRLQDETGGFTAFIPWTWQPGSTPLAGDRPRCPTDSACIADGKHLHLSGATEYLRTLAVSRIVLDNVANIQASWVTQGGRVGQIALLFGANDLGSVMMEENVVASAGVTFRLDERRIRRLIAAAGYEPKRRNCYYQLIE